MQYLLDRGVDVNAQSKEMQTPLHYLWKQGDQERLLHRHADPDCKDRKGNRRGCKIRENK